MNMGIIEVDLFSEDVKSADHPKAVRFKRLPHSPLMTTC